MYYFMTINYSEVVLYFRVLVRVGEVIGLLERVWP
jgi:hypothetical protein